MTLSHDDGIVVWRSRKGDAPMEFQSVPASLQDRLGAEGTCDLVRLFETARAEWSNDVLNLSLERFERRLVQEITGLRVEMVRGQATLREELAQEGATLRQELAQQSATLRQELAQQSATLREALAQQGATLREALAQESSALHVELAGLRTELKGDMQEGFASLRLAIANDRFELLKWSFLFWVGQVFAIVALVGAMLRALGPGR